MSFFSPPEGLIRSARYARFVGERPPADWNVGAGFSCPPPPDSGLPEFACVGMTSQGHDVTADISDIQYFGADFAAAGLDFAEYYTVQVSGRGPSPYHGGSPGCSSDPYGCMPFDPWTQEMTLDGDFVAWQTGAPVTLSDSTISDFAVIGPALLVNPAPTWPTPDADGNTFGSVLFEADQIPETVSAFVDVFARYTGETGHTAQVVVYLWPYLPDDVTEEDLPRMCLVDGA